MYSPGKKKVQMPLAPIDFYFEISVDVRSSWCGLLTYMEQGSDVLTLFYNRQIYPNLDNAFSSVYKP